MVLSEVFFFHYSIVVKNKIMFLIKKTKVFNDTFPYMNINDQQHYDIM